MDRKKLSRVVYDQLREREHENRGWLNEIKLRLSHAWGRFGALSMWEKSMIAGASLLFVMAVPAVIVAFSSGGGDSDDSSVTAPRRTVERSSTPFPTATPYPRTSATPRPIAVGGSPPVAPPAPPDLSPEPINRQDCDAIKGTSYQSEEERIWYLNNHCGDVQEDDGGSPTEPPTEPPPPPPTEPPPDQGLTASQAISLGAHFLGASSGSCSASDNGTHWRVSCLMGGQTTAVCVFEQPVLVDYC